MILHGVQELYCTHPSPDKFRYFTLREWKLGYFQFIEAKWNKLVEVLLVLFAKARHVLTKSAAFYRQVERLDELSLSSFKTRRLKIIHFITIRNFLQGVLQSLNYQTFCVKFAFSLEIDVRRIVNLEYWQIYNPFSFHALTAIRSEYYFGTIYVCKDIFSQNLQKFKTLS